MKKYYGLLLSALLLTACYNEDTLRPTELESISDKFDFPQGTSEADAVFERIYEQYGTKVIYKDFTEMDLNRAWLTPNSEIFDTRYRWNYIADPDQLLKAARTMEESVFGLLPQEMVRKAMHSYPYVYLMDSLHTVNMTSTDQWAVYPTKALDGLSVNLQMTAQPDQYSYKVYFPLRIALEVFGVAFNRGEITLPEAFYSEIGPVPRVDLKSYDDAKGDLYENYWARQGYMQYVRLYGQISLSKKSGFDPPSVIQPFTGRNQEVPHFFLFLSIDRNWRDYFKPGGIFEDCPRMQNRLNIFYNHMKEEYGIDFDEIQRKLYDREGVNVDTDPNRYYVRGAVPAADIFKYIYS